MKVIELFEGFHTDQRNKMLKVQTGIAKILKLQRYKVVTYRQAELNLDHGIRWLIAAPLPEGVDVKDRDEVNFQLGMFRRAVQKEILKEFGKWKLNEVEVHRWEGKKDMMVCTFYLPDSDGLLP